MTNFVMLTKEPPGPVPPPFVISCTAQVSLRIACKSLICGRGSLLKTDFFWTWESARWAFLESIILGRIIWYKIFSNFKLVSLKLEVFCTRPAVGWNVETVHSIRMLKISLSTVNSVEELNKTYHCIPEDAQKCGELHWIAQFMMPIAVH